MSPTASMSAGPDSVRRWRNATGAVFRHEWRMMAHAPLAPVFLAGFLLSLAIAVFLIGDLYSTDVANAELLWTFLPWVALIFVPALAMNAFVDEPGNRGLELTLTLPLPLSAIAAGTWGAGTAFLLVALAGTLPVPLTLAYLGSPDWGVILAGYTGAALLLASFHATALLAAAIMREPVASYVLGLFLLFVLLLLGWDAGIRLLRDVAGAGIINALTAVSPKSWLDRAASGLLPAGMVLSAIVLVGLALAGVAGALLLRGRGGLGNADLKRAIPVVLAAIAAGLVVIAATSRLPFALDLTAEREFTLHKDTASIASSLPAGTTIDLYWSAGETKVPAAIRIHARRVRDLLHRIAAHSKGAVGIREHEAAPDNAAETAAIMAGVQRVPMSSGDHFLLGAVFRRADRQGVITYFDSRRDQLLEYDVTQAMASLSRSRTPRVGILSPLLAPTSLEQPREGLSFLQEIRKSYDVAIVPHFADTMPEGLDVLLVIGATILKREMLYSIDQHVMNGKGLIVLADPHTRFHSASDLVAPDPSEDINDISDLLLKYGARLHVESVVGDASLAAPVADSQGRQLAYPFWLRLRRPGLSAAHAVTADLHELMLAEAGYFTFEGAGSGVPLMTTTAGSGLLPRGEIKERSSEALAALFKVDGTPRVLGVALDSERASAFGGAAGAASGVSHRSRSEGPITVFAIADVDWLFDPLALQEVSAGGKTIARPLNDNIAFLLNTIEVAAGDPRLLRIRSRGSLQRPFTRIAAMLAEAQERYREEERGLVQRIDRVEGDIGRVLKLAGAERVEQLPPDIQTAIGKLRSELAPHRQKLRELRATMRQDIEQLGRRITLANLAAPPLAAFAFATLLRLWRRRRHRTYGSKP